MLIILAKIILILLFIVFAAGVIAAVSYSAPVCVRAAIELMNIVTAQGITTNSTT